MSTAFAWLKVTVTRNETFMILLPGTACYNVVHLDDARTCTLSTPPWAPVLHYLKRSCIIRVHPLKHVMVLYKYCVVICHAVIKCSVNLSGTVAGLLTSPANWLTSSLAYFYLVCNN